MYTLLLTDGSHYIDRRAAERVETALRLNVDQFLITVKVCGTNEPDRLVAVRAGSVVSLVAHDAAFRTRNVVALSDRRKIPVMRDGSAVRKAL